MKNILIIGLVLFSLSINAQSISNYKYIAIADELPDFKKNNYNIDVYMQHLLEKKGYTVIRGNEENWPQELKNNSCSVLRANPVPGKYFLKIKITVDFTDCKGEKIASYEAHSSIENYKAAYQDALKTAFVQLPISIGKESFDLNQITDIQPPSKEKETPKVFEPIPTTEAEKKGIFRNNSIEVTLLITPNEKLLLIDNQNDAIYAELIPTSRNGVYRVNLIQADKKIETLGFYDGNSIEIEMDNQNIILQKTK